MSDVVRDRLNAGFVLLAAAITTQDREVRAMYLAEARNVLVPLRTELSLAVRSLERMEEEAARKPYKKKGEPE